MIDPIESLAFSLQANPGVYALVLGSGVSRGAGVPTGQDILLDLVAKLAGMRGAPEGVDPHAWYVDAFGHEPDYSEVLRDLCKTPAERRNLLRGYFEPTAEEREEGVKIPSQAHVAIASLVSRGYVRVIVTTNFDRLVELALEQKGIVPQVIATAASVRGSLPIVHEACTIIKVNGDYVDTSIRNTRRELSRYPRGLVDLLERVFDDFGLIVCGWSADWDVALRNAIAGALNRRFSAYWCTRGSLMGPAKTLVDARRATVVAITDADGFFSHLDEQVATIADLNRPHPMSVGAAVASVKRLLPDDRDAIRLSDLFMGEVDAVGVYLQEWPPLPNAGVDSDIKQRIARLDSQLEKLVAMSSVGCHWGGATQTKVWRSVLRTLVGYANQRTRDTRTTGMLAYPAVLFWYAAGLGAFAAGRYDTIQTLLMTPIRYGYNEKERPFVVTRLTMQADYAPALREARRDLPLNDHLYDRLREPLRPFLPDDLDYRAAFDRLEFLLSATCLLLEPDGRPPPMGLFAWRWLHDPEEAQAFIKEAQTEGDNWAVVKGGMFEGSAATFSRVFNDLMGVVRHRQMY